MGLRSDERAIVLRVLGPFAISIDGESVEVSRPQVRQFLALLAAEAGRPVSIDRLEEDLWPDTLPSSLKGALQRVVHRARSLFGEIGSEVIVFEPGSYRLSLDACAVDLDQWYREVDAARRLVTADRVQGAIKRFGAARDLWRGEPFTGVGDSQTLERERTRIAQERAAVDLDEAAALLSVDRCAAAARILEQTSLLEPLREDVARARMQALHRSARTAEALRVAAELRSALREQLGASPSPAFDEDERRMLASDTDEGADAAGARRPSASTRGWRAPLVDAVVSHVRRELTSGTPSPVLVAAAGRGFGLTTFLARVIEALSDAIPDVVVHHVHRGSCIEHSLHAVVEDLELAARPVDAQEPALLVDALAEGTVESPILVVVDDVEELDDWSWTFVWSLASWLPERVALVVGTHVGARRAGAPVELEPSYVLGPFDREETERLVGEALPDLPADARRRVADRVLGWRAGDPAATQTAIGSIAEHGESATLPLPSGHLERVEAQLASLDESSRQLITQAAVLGPAIDCSLLADVTGEPTESIVARIGLALGVGLVKRATTPGGWDFVDAPTREVLISQLDVLTTNSVHLRAAQALLARPEHCAPAAFHLLAALPLGDPVVAVRTAAAGGLERLQQHRYDDAALLFRRAAELLDDPAAAAEARLGEALALEQLGDHDRADEIYRSIVDDPSATSALVARAALGGAGRASRIGGQPDRRHRLVLAHRRLSDGDPYADQVAAELALEQLNGGVPLTPGITERLRAIADDDTSPGQLLALRFVLVLDQIERGPDLDGARRLAGLALAPHPVAGRHHAGAALAVSCHLLLAAGEWGEGDALIDEFERFGRRSGEPRSRWQALAFRAALTAARGAPAEAADLAAAARDLGRRLGLADAEATYGLHHIGLAFRAGSLAAFAPTLGGIEERYRVPVWHALRGLAELDAGAASTAHALLHEACGALQGRLDPLRGPAVALTCLLAARLGRVAELGPLRASLDDRTDAFLFLGYGGPFLGPTDGFRAAVARSEGNLADAEELEASARAACQRSGASFDAFGRV